MPHEGVRDARQEQQQLEALHRLDEECVHLQRTGNYLKAFDCMERALVLRRHFFGVESPEVLAACRALAEMCNLLSMSFLQQDNYAVAIDLLKKAEILSQQHPKEKATTLNNLACYYRRLGKLHTALTCLKKALAIEKRTLRDTKNAADTHLNMCAVLSQLGKHEDALQHAQAALVTLQDAFFSKTSPSKPSSTTTTSAATADAPVLDASAQLDRVSVMCIAYHNIGVEQEFLKDYEASVLSYKKGVGLAEQYLGVDHAIATTIRNSYLAAKRAISTKAMSARHTAASPAKSPLGRGSSPRVRTPPSSLRLPSPVAKEHMAAHRPPMSPRSIVADALARGNTLPPLEGSKQKKAASLSPDDPFFSPRFRFDGQEEGGDRRPKLSPRVHTESVVQATETEQQQSVATESTEWCVAEEAPTSNPVESEAEVAFSPMADGDTLLDEGVLPLVQSVEEQPVQAQPQVEESSSQEPDLAPQYDHKVDETESELQQETALSDNDTVLPVEETTDRHSDLDEAQRAGPSVAGASESHGEAEESHSMAVDGEGMTPPTPVYPMEYTAEDKSVVALDVVPDEYPSELPATVDVESATTVMETIAHGDDGRESEDSSHSETANGLNTAGHTESEDTVSFNEGDVSDDVALAGGDLWNEPEELTLHSSAFEPQDLTHNEADGAVDADMGTGHQEVDADHQYTDYADRDHDYTGTDEAQHYTDEGHQAAAEGYHLESPAIQVDDAVADDSTVDDHAYAAIVHEDAGEPVQPDEELREHEHWIAGHDESAGHVEAGYDGDHHLEYPCEIEPSEVHWDPSATHGIWAPAEEEHTISEAYSDGGFSAVATDTTYGEANVAVPTQDDGLAGTEDGTEESQPEHAAST